MVNNITYTHIIHAYAQRFYYNIGVPSVRINNIITVLVVKHCDICVYIRTPYYDNKCIVRVDVVVNAVLHEYLYKFV